jgi:hypothetical protein
VASALLFSMVSNAQIKTPEKGSIWVYNYSNLIYGGPIVAIYDRDSVILGKTTLVLNETTYLAAGGSGNPDIDTAIRIGALLHIVDSVVFYWNNNKFEILYDFGAKVGEEWSYSVWDNKYTVRAVVVNKGVRNNLGAFVELEFTDFFERPWRETIYEKTLCGEKYILPWDETLKRLDSHQGGPLQCFSNGQGRYSDKTWTPGGAACADTITKLSVDKIAKDKLFTIYPNPSSGIISISAHQKPVRMEVYSTLGDLVYSSETEFKTQTLSPQLYVVKLWRNDGGVEVHRVLVE